ncbi:MAG: DUF3857 domain-containing protein [Acidobacteriota bacterium]|nr:DUF3857 domain-containing protein [Acidobacteriota bacterium]
MHSGQEWEMGVRWIRRTAQVLALAALMVGTLWTSGLEAADWPKISDAERALTEAPGFSEASAVVLLSQGVLTIDREARSSSLDVYHRIKILKEDGLEYANGELLSSRFRRLKGLEGRTHKPDGTIAELPDEATFTERYSEIYKRQVHTFAMPEVEVGSIVEYRYRVYFDSILYSDPWFFQESIPVLRSEFTLDKPQNIGFVPHQLVSPQFQVQVTSKDGPRGAILTYALEDLPPIPIEPASYPFEDLSSQILFLPYEVYYSGQKITLLKDWQRAIEIFEGSGDRGTYSGARRKDRKSKAQAKSLVGSAREPREKALAVYRWVRDEIDLQPILGIGLPEVTCDKILERGSGDFMEKTILLECMLDAVGLDARLGWSRPRNLGRVHRSIPNPYQFDIPVVEVWLGNERVFLDASVPEIAFGGLRAWMEGADCLLVDAKEPEWATLPTSAPESNLRHATVDLQVTADGGVSGTGRLELTGLHAQLEMDRSADEAEIQQGWQEWLEERWSGFDIADVTVKSDVAARQIVVTWSQAQREEEILGDEVTLRPARPLGLVENPFTLTPDRRRTPVLLAFADVDEVELTLRWPEGWSLDATPRVANLDNAAGSIVTQAQVNPAERTLTYSRRLEISDIEFSGPGEYGQLYSLYDLAFRSDAEAVALILE